MSDNEYLNKIEESKKILKRILGSEYEIKAKSIREALKYYLIRNILGYGDVTYPLADEYVEDISCDRPSSTIKIWHKRYNDKGWLESNIFLTSNELDTYISKLAYRSGKNINVLQPVLEGTLPEGYRVTATWRKEISPRGSSFTIRKFRSKPYTLPELVYMGVMNASIAAYLWRLVELKKFIIIIGPSGAGKTTLLNALAHLIHPNLKIISIEEVQEIHLPYHPSWKPFVTRSGIYLTEYNIFDLLRVALRERADYIILGESRGEEARLIFQAAATGHGCITTFHASDLREALARLTSRPILVDPSMINLIDTVVALRFQFNKYNAPNKRILSNVYRQVNEGWIELYNYDLNGKDFDIINERKEHLLDLDIDQLKIRRDFLKYLVKIKSFDPKETIERIFYFYQGAYRHINGRWILEGVYNESRP